MRGVRTHCADLLFFVWHYTRAMSDTEGAQSVELHASAVPAEAVSDSDTDSATPEASGDAPSLLATDAGGSATDLDDRCGLLQADAGAVHSLVPQRQAAAASRCDWRLWSCSMCWLATVVVLVVLLVVLAVRSNHGAARAAVVSGGGASDWPAAELGENATEAALEQSTWRALAATLRAAAAADGAQVDVCTQGYYAHVCGGWARANNVSEQSSESSFSQTAARIEQQLLSVAEQGWPLVGAWWTACRNSTARRLESLQPAQTLLNVAAQVNSPQTLGRALALLHRAGVAALFDVFVAEDERAPHQRQLFYVAQTEPLVPYAVWSNNASALAAQQRTQLVELVDALLGEQLGEQALRVEETLLAPYTRSATDERHAPPPTLVNRTALAASHFDWSAYWAALFPASSSSSAVGAPDQVALTNAAYLEQATTLPQHTSWLSVRAYLLMRVLVTVLPDLPPPANDTAPVSADECLQSVEAALGDQLGHYYVRAQFDEQSRDDIEQMIADVLAAFDARLRALPWMDVPTRQRALEKLHAIRPLVAYPDSWALDSPPFAVHACCHLANALGWRAAVTQRSLESWPHAAPRYHWLMRAYEVNAYYSPPDNDVVFPAGILQGPFYHRRAPLALNYGGLGAVCGHEVTHAFDDQGREYDADGVLRDWWSPYAAQQFERRAQCVVDLYSSYAGVDNQSVDGELTLGENLADMGGMATARDAYAAALQRRYPAATQRAAYEQLVQREFGMTHMQLFYAGYAYTWCSHTAPDRAYTRLRTDPHSPPRWRVDGPTSQSQDWAHTFGCTPNATACSVF